jgi:mannose-6-phosphate isomerase-like protein (cupin superfamily)
MSVGIRFMAWGEETGGGFSLVEHPIVPKTLAAPVHIHEKEDEYSYVLEGRLGALLGDEVVYADPGEFVFKSRKQWHTVWNAGDTEYWILEIISPSGFEHFFAELAELVAQGARPIRSSSSPHDTSITMTSRRAPRWPRSTACTSRCRRPCRRLQATKRRSTAPAAQLVTVGELEQCSFWGAHPSPGVVLGVPPGTSRAFGMADQDALHRRRLADYQRNWISAIQHPQSCG